MLFYSVLFNFNMRSRYQIKITFKKKVYKRYHTIYYTRYSPTMSILLHIDNYVREATPIFYYTAIFLGVTALLPYVFTALYGLYKLFRKRKNLKNRYGDNAWALITGSSEGIGREIANELAKEGINIVLLARTQAKLKIAQEQLQAKYPSISVEYMVADLSLQGQKENIDEVLPQLQKYDFSILVNNAGVDKLDLHQKFTLAEVFNHININCLAVCALTYKFSKLFKDKIKRTGKKCAIINVASIAGGQIPVPYFSLYSGTKAYVSKLTKNLAIEIPEIDWLILNPSEVSTAMTCFKSLDLFTITPQQCAKGAIDDLGYDLVTNGHISHKIQSFIYSVLPLSLFNLIWMKIFAPEGMVYRKQFQESRKEKQNDLK